MNIWSRVLRWGKALQFHWLAGWVRKVRKAERKLSARKRAHYRRVAFEHLGQRVMFTVYYIDPGVSSPDLGDAVCRTDPSTGPDVVYPNTAGNSLAIQNCAATIKVPGNLVADSITIGAGGPFELEFTSTGASTVSGGSIQLQTDLTVAVDETGATVEIDSAITGAGKLTKTQIGTLVIASAANTYAGGTDVSDGEIQLKKDPTSGLPAALGAGGVIMGRGARLDLNGCSLVIDSLNNEPDSENATVGDFSSSAPGTMGGITTLSIAGSSNSAFFGAIVDETASDSGSNATSLRLIKAGSGDFLDNAGIVISGGVEIDEGRFTLDETMRTDLTMNGGTLDLNNHVLTAQTLEGLGGAITDDSTTTPALSEIDVKLDVGSHPAVFGGAIVDNFASDPSAHAIPLTIDGPGQLILTGQNNFSGGTQIDGARLQIGDGQTTGTTFGGQVIVASQDGLTFNVPEGVTENFAGSITGTTENNFYEFGSVLKTGPGTLKLTPNGPDSYGGALRVDQGKLVLGNGDSLAAGTQLIIDNGAIVDLNGHATAALASVTVNDGSIISTNGSGTNIAGIITASDAFSLSNGTDATYGTIGSMVTLAGDASLFKRTTGSVTINGTASYTGGTYVDQGTLSGGPTPTTVTVLYWDPPTTDGTWSTSEANWSLTGGTGGTLQSWPTSGNYAAVFDPMRDQSYSSLGNTVTISGAVAASAITFDAATFDVEDDGMTGSEISIPVTSSVVVAVPGTVSGAPTLGAAIVGDGGITKEGSGTILLGASGKNNSYNGGTFIDDGTVMLASAGALGTVNTNLADNVDVAVSGNGVLDLNSQSITITALNSSYGTSTPNGLVTDTSGTGSTTLLVEAIGASGVFAGSIAEQPGPNQRQISLGLTSFDYASGFSGLLLTLTGDNSFSGGTAVAGSLQIGDWVSAGTIQGAVGFGTSNGDMIFDVPDGTTATFDGEVVNNTSFGASVLKIGGGLLQFGGTNTYGGATRIEFGTVQLTSTTALPGNTFLYLDNDGILDLDGNSPADALRTATLNNGEIEDSAASGAAVDATGLFIVYAGNISANLGGTAALLNSPDVFSDTAVLTGDNTYSNGTFVESGAALQLGDGTTGHDGTVAGNVVDNGSLVFNVVSSAYDFSQDIIGTVDSAGTVTKLGSGTVVLSGDNTYAGGTIVLQGILQIAAYAALPSGGSLQVGIWPDPAPVVEASIAGVPVEAGTSAPAPLAGVAVYDAVFQQVAAGHKHRGAGAVPSAAGVLESRVSHPTLAAGLPSDAVRIAATDLLMAGLDDTTLKTRWVECYLDRPE